MSNQKPLASELGTKVYAVKDGVDLLHPAQPDDITDVEKAGEELYAKIAGMSHDLVQSDKGDPATWGS